MKRTWHLLDLSILGIAATFAQTPARPEFEVASIRPTASMQDGQFSVGVHIDGAMVRIHSYSLRDYIELAYDVRDYQVSGPEWLDSAKFDLNAKFADTTQRSKLAEMVKTLLEDRFKLTARIEKKDWPVYALTVAKTGLKLKEVTIDEAVAPDQDKNNVDVSVNAGTNANGRGSSVVDLGHGASISSANGRIEGRKIRTADLVETLWRYVDRPVVDMTGLTGRYDMSLAYGVEELRNMLRVVHVDRPIPDGALPPASIFDSLKALGLVLEARKAPLDIVVIDRIEKTPSAN